MTATTNDDFTGLGTECVHAGNAADSAMGAVASPLYLSTTFERDADGGYSRGYRYSREGTPNRAALESCVAALERGSAAIAFPSGLAASMAILEQLRPGDRVIAPRETYFGVRSQLRNIIASRGVTVEFIDAWDPSQLTAALRKPTRLVWVETPANPSLSITHLAHTIEHAHAVNALVVCDNTFATPVCQRPLELGADAVLHSGTKYLGGHSDVLSGIVVVRTDSELIEQLRTWQSVAGSVLAPFDCWLLRRSISTLAVRVRQQCASALSIATLLSRHPKIERVLYPGLPGHPGHLVAAQQMPGGFGAMMSLCFRGGMEDAVTASLRTRLFRRATSLGGVESLIEHRSSIEGPESTTPANLLRISVGLEDTDDLRRDLLQAIG
jgi:cystathionine gamma-synthase